MHFHFDGLITAVAADIEAYVMSFFTKLAHRFVRNAALEFDVAARFSHLFAGRFIVAFVLPARRIAGFLRV